MNARNSRDNFYILYIFLYSCFIYIYIYFLSVFDNMTNVSKKQVYKR